MQSKTFVVFPHIKFKRIKTKLESKASKYHQGPFTQQCLQLLFIGFERTCPKKGSETSYYYFQWQYFKLFQMLFWSTHWSYKHKRGSSIAGTTLRLYETKQQGPKTFQDTKTAQMSCPFQIHSKGAWLAVGSRQARMQHMMWLHGSPKQPKLLPNPH